MTNLRTTRTADTGMTLIETLVTVSLMGLVAAVIGAAVTVVFRTDDGIVSVVGESHDVQQAANYFHLDIESGPALVAEYFFDGDGCAAAPNRNVVRFDTDPDGDTSDADLTDDRRIAYRISTLGSSAELDRVECTLDGSTWVEASVVNVADELRSAGSPVTVTVIPGSDPIYVDRVEMTFDQRGTDRDVAASPRAESGELNRPGVGGCAGNPLEHTLGFGSFVEGDMYLDNGQVLGSLAVGGEFGWSGTGRTIGAGDFNNTNGFPKVTLYAGSVAWAHAPTSGPLATADSSSKSVVLGGSYWVKSNPANKQIFQTSPGTDPHILINKNASVHNVSAYPLDFTQQFDLLKSCAHALAALPYGADADHAELTYSDGNTNIEITRQSPGGDTWVLNIPEEKLIGIDTLTAGSSLSNGNPLIINITEDSTDGDDDIHFDVATVDWTSFGDYKRVLYNFIDVNGTVYVDSDIYGTIFSPFTPVETNFDVYGAVIASTWTHNGGDVDNDTEKMFNATIDWTP